MLATPDFDMLVSEFKSEHGGRHPLDGCPAPKRNTKRERKARQKAKRRSAAILRQSVEVPHNG